MLPSFFSFRTPSGAEQAPCVLLSLLVSMHINLVDLKGLGFASSIPAGSYSLSVGSYSARFPESYKSGFYTPIQ